MECWRAAFRLGLRFAAQASTSAAVWVAAVAVAVVRAAETTYLETVGPLGRAAARRKAVPAEAMRSASHERHLLRRASMQRAGKVAPAAATPRSLLRRGRSRVIHGCRRWRELTARALPALDIRESNTRVVVPGFSHVAGPWFVYACFPFGLLAAGAGKCSMKRALALESSPSG